MFHPIGPQNPTVYWRRRLAMLGAVVLVLVLAVLTIDTMRSDGASKPAAQSNKPTVPASSGSKVVGPPPVSTSVSAPTSTTGQSKSSAKSPSRVTTTAQVTSCVTKNLTLRAVVGQQSYQVGDKPKLQLQVTNSGSAPCIQNLADSQVEMRVYNGESRVWGSHDCKIAPGTTLRTLVPKVPVLVSIEWSGLSSQPKCAGTRQRVNAGTYTLYTALAGRTGTATQFSIG